MATEQTRIGAEQRLVSYGTLAPGRENHGQLDGLHGRWLPGRVRGVVGEGTWRSTFGYPVLVLDPDGPVVDVLVFESPDLPDHWDRLDAFEGPGYRRVVTRVDTAEGVLDACVYVLDVP